MPIRRTPYEQFIYTIQAISPSIEQSTLVIIMHSSQGGILRGQLRFRDDFVLDVSEVLNFRAGVIEAYGYAVWQGDALLYWYDSHPHPADPALAATHPHHKHTPPDTKHHRVPAPGLRFDEPNLSFLVREIEELLVQAHFVQAREKVRAFLAPYDGHVLDGQIEIDETLDEASLAVHHRPDTVAVRSADVPESVIAHELVHVAQRTMEQFRGFRLLYVLLAEGLAEFVAKSLYPEHEVKYVSGYEVVALLVETVPGVIGDLLHINGLLVTPDDVEKILTSPCLPPATRRLLMTEGDLIRDSVRRAWEIGLADDPTFVTLGEEMRAWKFLLDERFESLWGQLYQAIEPWFEVEDRQMGGE